MSGNSSSMRMRLSTQSEYDFKNPEDFPICQVFHSQQKQIIPFPASYVNNKTAKQILELISSQISIDSKSVLKIVISPKHSLLLEDSDKPFSISDSLFFFPVNFDIKKTLYKNYLEVTSIKKDIFSSIFIPVIDQHSKFLYMFPIQSTAGSFRLYDVINLLLKVHRCPSDSISVYSKKGQLLDSQKIHNVHIKSVLKENIYLSLFVNDQISKQIQNRVNILNEFKSNQINFYKQIKGFIENVTPIFQKTNILTKKELDDFNKAVKYLVTLQENIANDLSDMEIDYMMPLGSWFRQFVPYLKGYNQYMTFYKTYQPRIEGAMNSKENQQLFEKFSQSSFSNNLRFDSILIIPVQIPPRYIILLREAIKNTPESHPDYDDLISTFDMVEEIVNILNREVSDLQKKQELMMFESMFSPKVELIRPNRSYIGYYRAQYKNANYNIHLFSDEVWLSTVGHKKLTRKRTFSYTNSNAFKFAEKSVVIRCLDSIQTVVDFIFLLEDSAQQARFISEFRSAAINFLRTRRDQIKLQFSQIAQEDPVCLADHSMTFVNGKFFVFGGRDATGAPHNDLYSFSLDDPTFRKVAFKKNYPAPPPRFMAAVCSIDTGVFIFGGTDDGKRGLDDFWFFSFRHSRFQELSRRGDPESDPPPGGFGLDLFYTRSKTRGDVLILSGGRDEFGVYAFVLKEKRWKYVEFKSGIDVLSLYGHSVVPLPDKLGHAFIIGGKNANGEYNNFPLFMTNDGEVIQPVVVSQINPINRFQHKCAVVDDTIFCFGGDADENIPFALHIGLAKFTVPQTEGEKKNFPVRGFALATDGHFIVMHGGFDRKGKNVAILLKIDISNPEEQNDPKMGIMNDLTITSFDKDQFAFSIISNPKSVKDDIWVGE